MISYDDSIQLIKSAMNSLYQAGLLEQELDVSDDTVLLGLNSPLDSIAFVTFITELEDRLNQLNGHEELYLVFKDIHEFNADASYLSAGVLARYLTKFANGNA